MATFKHINAETLPREWTIKFLQDLVTYRLGRTPPRNDKQYWDNGVYPWISIADMSPYATIFETSEKVSEEAHNKLFQKRLTPAGTILMSFKLTIGRVAKLGIPAYHNEAIISIFSKDRKILFDDYLFYYLSQIDYRQYQDTAVKGMTLNKGKIDSLEIPVPPLDEQRRIASLLTTVQNAIAQQERLIELTSELKRALMHKLFTEGLRGEKQKQTEIGLVPESWEVVELGEVIDYFNGYAFKSKENVSESNTQLVRMGNLYKNKLDLTRSPIFYPDDFAVRFSRYVLKQGDLIMSLTGTTGKEDYGFTIEVKADSITLLLNQRVTRIDIISERLLKDFVFYFLLSRQFLDQLYPTAKGMKQANLSTHVMKNLKILIPNHDEQTALVLCFRAFDKKIELASKKKTLLEELFRTLLHQLMTAQIRVNELEL